MREVWKSVEMESRASSREIALVWWEMVVEGGWWMVVGGGWWWLVVSR